MLMARARGVCARAARERGEQEAAAGPSACSALEGAGGLCPPVLAQTHSCCGVTWARDSMAGNRLFIHPGAAQGPGFAPVGVVLSSSALPSLFAPMPALDPSRCVTLEAVAVNSLKTVQSWNQTARGRTEKLKLAEMPQAEGHLGLSLVSLLTFISFIYNLWLIDFFFFF